MIAKKTTIKKMRILVTGNTGYIGPVLANYLKKNANQNFEIVGYDQGYFAHCLTDCSYMPEFNYDKQYWGDLREFPFELLNNIDCVIHLAAISNDPMGNKFEKITKEINYQASINIAREAKARGVRSFVFASSCSIYGIAEDSSRKENNQLNPLTAYAKSKVAMEKDLSKLADKSFVVTALRFATACGMSSRLRLDLVLNDFVACALTSKVISVLSDGSPWRPLIDVIDMSRAISWAIDRKFETGGPFLPINTGSKNWNYQIKDLANIVSRLIPGTKVSINSNAKSDERSYRVDFSLFEKLAPMHQPVMSIEETIKEIVQGLKNMQFSDSQFRSSKYMRLKVLQDHIESDRLNLDLKWTEFKNNCF
jgi:nucleoside-diphosphate-sugar epimerase